MSEESYDASNPEVVKKKRLTEKQALEREINDLRVILSMPEGVRFFQRIIAKGGVFETTFVGNSHSFFNEGRRSFALEILRGVREATPEKLAEIFTYEK